MAFLIYTRDKPDSENVRAKHRADHYAYLEAHIERLLASGGIQDDAGTCFVGAAIIVDYDTREEVEAFVARDPFASANLFESIEIVRWKPAFLGGMRS